MTSSHRYFYPRPPRGGRLIPSPIFLTSAKFLSTPSARRATPECSPRSAYRQFLSTPSARRATVGAPPGCFHKHISIHALREEGDSSGKAQPAFLIYFYPRPPRGGRPQKRRKISPLLFHYKTICTDLEELFQKHPKKEPRSAQNALKTWCEGDGKRVSAFHSHRGEG